MPRIGLDKLTTFGYLTLTRSGFWNVMTLNDDDDQVQPPSLQQVGTGTEPGHLVLAKALLNPDSRAVESTKVQTNLQSSLLNPLQ